MNILKNIFSNKIFEKITLLNAFLIVILYPILELLPSVSTSFEWSFVFVYLIVNCVIIFFLLKTKHENREDSIKTYAKFEICLWISIFGSIFYLFNVIIPYTDKYSGSSEFFELLFSIGSVITIMYLYTSSYKNKSPLLLKNLDRIKIFGRSTLIIIALFELFRLFAYGNILYSIIVFSLVGTLIFALYFFTNEKLILSLDSKKIEIISKSFLIFNVIIIFISLKFLRYADGINRIELFLVLISAILMTFFFLQTNKFPKKKVKKIKKH